MDLTTARRLKQELQAFLDSEPIRDRGGRIRLGIAPTSRAEQFNIAVQGETEQDLPSDLVDVLRVRTAGEIDVRITGRIEVRLPADLIQPDLRQTGYVPPKTYHTEIRYGGSNPRSVTTVGQRLMMGASVGHYKTSAGTLGFFARRTSDGAIGFVSNNHVIAAEDRGADRDDVLHPARADRGSQPKDVVAVLSGSYPRLHTGFANVDCAFALLREDVNYDPWALPMGQKLKSSLPPLDGQRAVSKVGRSSLRTYGRITAFELDKLDVYYPGGVLQFSQQLQIESGNNLPFSKPGDSGSLIFGPDGHALGLLFAMSALGGAWRSGLSYANPIQSVLTALGVTLVV